MSIQRMFSIFLVFISILGIYGSLQVRLFQKASIGPGLMPLVYSFALLVFSILFFFTDKGQPKMNWRGLFKHYAVDGLIYYLLNFGMLILTFFIGMAPAMLVFGISNQLILKRQNLLWATLFNIIWVGAVYLIFVYLLEVPFEIGLLGQLFR